MEWCSFTWVSFLAHQCAKMPFTLVVDAPLLQAVFGDVRARTDF